MDDAGDADDVVAVAEEAALVIPAIFTANALAQPASAPGFVV